MKEFPFRSTTRVTEADQELADGLMAVRDRVEELAQRLTLIPAGEPETNGEIKVATVRMPAALYDALVNEAHERRTSLNRLCITKLAAALPEDARVLAGGRTRG